MTYEQLVGRRDDAIRVHIQGRANGGPAVDYTINAKVGVPQMTGREYSSLAATLSTSNQNHPSGWLVRPCRRHVGGGADRL